MSAQYNKIQQIPRREPLNNKTVINSPNKALVSTDICKVFRIQHIGALEYPNPKDCL